MIRRILDVTGFEKTVTAESDTNLGPAIKHACDQSLEAMKKPDGSFRTYNEMVTEYIPLKYVGQGTAPAEFPNIGDDMQGKFIMYTSGSYLWLRLRWI
jgi:aldehyde oxidoreductase